MTTPTRLAADAWEAGKITTYQFMEISGGRMTLAEALAINGGHPIATPMAPIVVPPKGSIKELMTAPAKAKPGETIHIAITMINTGGSTAAGGDFHVMFVDGRGTNLGTRSFLGVSPGQEISASSLTFPMHNIASAMTIRAMLFYKGVWDGTSKEVTVSYIAPYVPVCVAGEKRTSHTCLDGTVIHREVCSDNNWVSSGETCPPPPAKGQMVSTISPPSARPGETITVSATVKNVGGSDGGFRIAVNGKMTEAFALAPGTQAARSVTMMMTGDTTSLDIKLYRGETLDDSRMVTITLACTEGVKRNPSTCWDDSAIHNEVCRDNIWVPTGETCPTKPECSPGDKKAGHVCEEGKWQTAPVEPEPPVVPTEGDLFTIEFQEMIPGIVPPRVPLLVPGMETLPLLPGWIVRDAAGNIVNKGAELPTLTTEP